jgi:predicted amidohydrolase
MRACIVPLKIESRNPITNLQNFKIQMELIARWEPDLICLPECTITGYLFEEGDLSQFAEPIQGPMVTRMIDIARKYQVYLCFGLLEHSPTGVFDSAVLLDRQGQILCLQRKNAEKPPFINGTLVESVKIEFGKMSILICGDLFNDEVLRKIKSDLQLCV